MKYTIATLASHSCLQILKGAKDEGFDTLAIASKDRVQFYRRYNFIDSIIPVTDYKDIYKLLPGLKKQKVIIIPHGSFVAYLGEDYDKKLEIPHYGNKKVLEWEGDRLKQNKWLNTAGLLSPKIIKQPSLINQLVIVKLFGAKGGSGYFLAQTEKEFNLKIKKFRGEKYIIQEYMVGTPVYLQYFYSGIKNNLELMGIDRRYETNIDGLSRIPGKFEKNLDFDPTFTVIGNFPLVIRESLLPEIYKMGERVIEASKKLIPAKGLYGPFCLETIITKNQKFYCIEISCRIVAGTNLFINGSPYTDLTYGEPMSTGRRIAREINEAIKLNRLTDILN